MICAHASQRRWMDTRPMYAQKYIYNSDTGIRNKAKKYIPTPGCENARIGLGRRYRSIQR